MQSTEICIFWIQMINYSNELIINFPQPKVQQFKIQSFDQEIFRIILKKLLVKLSKTTVDQMINQT